MTRERRLEIAKNFLNNYRKKDAVIRFVLHLERKHGIQLLIGDVEEVFKEVAK